MTKGIDAWKKAAHEGCSLAQFNLGTMNERASNSASEPAQRMHYLDEALFWLEKAAAQGHEESRRSIAILEKQKLCLDCKIRENILCERCKLAQYHEDLDRTIKAAEQGDCASQISLGTTYKKMSEAEPNFIKQNALLRQAIFWFYKAASQGDVLSQFRLGYIYKMRAISPVEAHHSTAFLAKAFEWFEKAALNGNAAAQYNIAALYLRRWLKFEIKSNKARCASKLLNGFIRLLSKGLNKLSFFMNKTPMCRSNFFRTTLFQKISIIDSKNTLNTLRYIFAYWSTTVFHMRKI